jgi:hypothetical protein
MIRGQRVADEVPGVVTDHGKPLVAERIHQRDQIAGEGPVSYPLAGLSDRPIPR